MSNAFGENLDGIDHEFERLVERAMRSCGWLLPRSSEEVRQAEEDPEIAATELPESLKDPLRILERALGGSAETPGSTKRETEGKKAIPTALAQLAIEVGLSYEQILTLFSMQGQPIFGARRRT